MLDTLNSKYSRWFKESELGCGNPSPTPKKPRLGLLLEPTSVEDMGFGKKPEPMQGAHLTWACTPAPSWAMEHTVSLTCLIINNTPRLISYF